MSDDDIIWGVRKISKHVKRSERQTYYGLERGHIPGFKMGNTWGLRPATWRAKIEAEERRAANGEAA